MDFTIRSRPLAPWQVPQRTTAPAAAPVATRPDIPPEVILPPGTSSPPVTAADATPRAEAAPDRLPVEKPVRTLKPWGIHMLPQGPADTSAGLDARDAYGADGSATDASSSGA